MERRGHLTAELCLSDAKKEIIYKCMNITFEIRQERSKKSAPQPYRLVA